MLQAQVHYYNFKMRPGAANQMHSTGSANQSTSTENTYAPFTMMRLKKPNKALQTGTVSRRSAQENVNI